MDLKPGDLVVYANSEVCVFSGTVKKSFTSDGEKEYVMVTPKYSSNSAYYLPAEQAEARLRPLITREKILDIIDNAQQYQESWCEDKNQRVSNFSSILKSGDHRQIFSMIKLLYDERERLSAIRKKLFSADEKAFAEGERLVNQEFAAALGIEEVQVHEFIRSRIAANEAAV